MTVTKTVYSFLDGYKTLDFTGWWLYENISEITKKCTYPNTLLQMVRNYCDITGATLVCTDAKKSKYHYERNFILGNNSYLDK